MLVSLAELIRYWLKDEKLNFRVRDNMIIYNPFGRWCGSVLDDHMLLFEIGRADMIIYACDEKFFSLISNRLHMMQLGFEQALNSRKHKD